METNQNIQRSRGKYRMRLNETKRGDLRICKSCGQAGHSKRSKKCPNWSQGGSAMSIKAQYKLKLDKKMDEKCKQYEQRLKEKDDLILALRSTVEAVQSTVKALQQAVNTQDDFIKHLQKSRPVHIDDYAFDFLDLDETVDSNSNSEENSNNIRTRPSKRGRHESLQTNLAVQASKHRSATKHGSVCGKTPRRAILTPSSRHLGKQPRGKQPRGKQPGISS